ncbi:MAG: MmcQ/YjbR family DNA-binding protein, partial [Thermoplasmata archaeon]|nr:MmcQ/YjbR family DNA-binding protein [Thermoplasmata archaeon]
NMDTIPEAALARFAKLAKQLADGDGSKLPYRDGFGTGSLFVGRKMFGVLDESGALVLKLPPSRVQELIATGVGKGWHPGTGKPLKEYVSVAVGHQAKWLGLARESREYMASK